MVKLSDLRRKQSQRLYLILNIGYHAVDGSLKKKRAKEILPPTQACILVGRSEPKLVAHVPGQGGLARTTSPQLNSFSREGQGEMRKAVFELGKFDF